MVPPLVKIKPIPIHTERKKKQREEWHAEAARLKDEKEMQGAKQSENFLDSI